MRMNVRIYPDIIAYAFREKQMTFYKAYLSLKIQDAGRNSGNIPLEVAKAHLGLNVRQWNDIIKKNPFLRVDEVKGVIQPVNMIKFMTQKGITPTSSKTVVVEEKDFDLLKSNAGIFALYVSAFSTISRAFIKAQTSLSKQTQLKYEEDSAVIEKKFNFAIFDETKEEAPKGSIVGKTADGNSIRQIPNTYSTPLETNRSRAKKHVWTALGQTQTQKPREEVKERKQSFTLSTRDKNRNYFFGSGSEQELKNTKKTLEDLQELESLKSLHILSEVEKGNNPEEIFKLIEETKPRRYKGYKKYFRTAYI